MSEVSEINTTTEHVAEGKELAKNEFDVPPVPELTKEANKKVDVLMAFGQGPVKPLMQESELSDDQKETWTIYKKDPLHNTEPDFRVIEGKAWTSQLEGKTEAEQDELIAGWQSQGRFGLNRWGRTIGLKTGLSLLSGQAETVLLSGGKTKPGWATEKFANHPKRLESMASEAQLMADVIKRRFGKLYAEKYGKSIDEAIILEDDSTNTLENVTNSVNKHPELLGSGKKVGLVGADFHGDRIEQIVDKLSPGTEISEVFGAQEGLRERNEERQGWRSKVKELAGRSSAEQNLEKRVQGAKEDQERVSSYRDILDWMKDADNPDLQKREAGEVRWTKGLSQPEFIGYWFGYIGYIEDPAILNDTIQAFKEDPDWTENARRTFKDAGLDEKGLGFDNLAEMDLSDMSRDEFREKIATPLTALTKREYRDQNVPPPEPVAS